MDKAAQKYQDELFEPDERFSDLRRAAEILDHHDPSFANDIRDHADVFKRQAARIAELVAKVAEKDEALLWYWSRVSGSMGDPPHQGYAGDLLEDRGARARAALGGEAGPKECPMCGQRNEYWPKEDWPDDMCGQCQHEWYGTP